MQTSLLDRTERFLRNIAAACLAAMALLTCCDVVGRGMGHPIFGSEEIVAFMAALCMAFALPFAHSQRSHIGVEILYRRLGEKTRKITDIVTSLLALGLFCLVTWQMAGYAMDKYHSGVLSMNLELPEYTIVAATAAGFAVFCLRLAVDVKKLLVGER
ncbi:MAG: TRAP transporter small permease [Desulfovibrio sp.]|uniref:TRAP transporter small permease n=1 Tax=Desulfovibrio sp. 7SRBS1 TaxID=3378064 RepID=UPI003B3C3547